MLSCRGKCTKQISKKIRDLVNTFYKIITLNFSEYENGFLTPQGQKDRQKVQKCISPCKKIFFKKILPRQEYDHVAINVLTETSFVLILMKCFSPSNVCETFKNGKKKKTIKMPLHSVCSFHTCSQLLWIENENAGGKLQTSR